MTHNLKLTCFAITILLASCAKKDIVTIQSQQTPSLAAITENDPLFLGNPTNAQTNVLLSENYLLDATYYKEAYSSSRAIPVWVGWHLQSEDLGPADRQDDFRANPKLPSNWLHVDNGNYSSSGFDRGHNCPSADRTLNVPANSSTFLMTNMIPQAPLFNQGPWAGLEDYVRSLVGTTNEAYIFMGNYGAGGVGSNSTVVNTIDNGNITVPKQVWKVAVIFPKGTNDLTRLDTSARVLVVNMPNDNRLYTTTPTGRDAWRNYLTTISALEAASNTAGRSLDFLSLVPASVRTYLKAKSFR